MLSPADFGITALAMTVISITEAVTELPLTSGMVGVEKPTPDLYNTAFTLAFLRGLVLALWLGGAALAMSAFYGDDRLVVLVWALALAPICRGLVSPKMVVFVRLLDFRQITVIEVIGKFAAFLSSSVTAATSHSYWAIAVATITTPLVMSTLSYWFAPYRPRFSLSHWGYFRDFVGWNSLSQFFAALNWQMDRLLLGRLVPKGTLGHFAMASNVVGILTQAVVVPMGGPLLSAYTLRKKDPDTDMARTHLKAMNAIFMVASCLYLGLALLASQAVIIALGPNWAETAELLRWSSLIAIITLPVYHLGSLAVPFRKLQMVAWRTFGEFVVAMPALFIGGLYFGIPGVIAARALSSLVVLAVGLEAVKRMVGCSIAAQLWALRRTVVALMFMAVVVIALRPFIANDGWIAIVVGSLAVSMAGAVAYVSALGSLWILAGRPDGLEKLVRDRISGSFFGNKGEAQ